MLAWIARTRLVLPTRSIVQPTSAPAPGAILPPQLNAPCGIAPLALLAPRARLSVGRLAFLIDELMVEALPKAPDTVLLTIVEAIKVVVLSLLLLLFAPGLVWLNFCGAGHALALAVLAKLAIHAWLCWSIVMLEGLVMLPTFPLARLTGNVIPLHTPWSSQTILTWVLAIGARPVLVIAVLLVPVSVAKAKS